MADAKHSPDRGVASNGLSSAWFSFDETTPASSEGTPDQIVDGNEPDLCPNGHMQEALLRTSTRPDQSAPASIEQPRPPQTRSAKKAVFQTPTNGMEKATTTQADRLLVAIPVGNEALPAAAAPIRIPLPTPKSLFARRTKKTWIIVAAAIVTVALLGVLFILAAILDTGKQPAESGSKPKGSAQARSDNEPTDQRESAQHQIKQSKDKTSDTGQPTVQANGSKDTKGGELVPLKMLNQDPAQFEGKTVVIRARVSGTVVEKPRKWLWLTVKGKEVTIEGGQVNKAGINFVVAKENKERLLTGLRDGDFARATITATVKKGKPGWLAVVSDIKLDQETPVKPKTLGGP